VNHGSGLQITRTDLLTKMFSVQVTLGFVGSVKIPHYSQTKVIEPSRERPVEIKVDPETSIKNFLVMFKERTARLSGISTRKLTMPST